MNVFNIPGLLELFESYSQHILATPSCKTVESSKSNSNQTSDVAFIDIKVSRSVEV